MAAAYARMLKAASDLGFTPASRSRIQLPDGHENKKSESSFNSSTASGRWKAARLGLTAFTQLFMTLARAVTAASAVSCAEVNNASTSSGSGMSSSSPVCGL